MHKNCRDIVRRLILEGLNNNRAGLLLISTCNFLRRHLACAGNLAVEIIAVCCAECRNTSAGLAEHSCPAAVCMHNTADIRERLIKLHMCCRIGRRIQLTLYFFTCMNINKNNILRAQLAILHATGLNRHNAALTVDTTDIAPCKCNKLMFGQQHIRLIYLFF